MILLLLAAARLTAPADWSFHDEATLAGRSALTFRAVELAEVPTRPLHPADKPPAGARFGVLPVGPGGKHRLAVVWRDPVLWVDADRDGRFAANERHTLGRNTLALAAAIPTGDGIKERTLVVRRRDDGLAYAVRGYVAGPLRLGWGTYPAALTDGDADGCFDGAAADRLWIDLNRDGKFNALTEQFPLGRPVAVGGTGYLVRPDPAGRRVSARERSTDSGMLTVKASRLAGAKVVGLTAQFVSEWGELVAVTAADEPRDVPVGRYRVESLTLKLEAADGRVWEYRFTGDPRTAVTVAKGAAAAADLTAGLKATVALSPESAGPGDEVNVTPDVVTAGGLSMTMCQVYERHADHGRVQEAVIRLAAPGSETLAETRSGFA